MNARESIPGMLRFGQGLSGKGIAIQIDTAPGTMPDKKLRPGGDVAKGPHGEDLPTRRETFEIKILAGRSGAKYSWQRVHPGPLGPQENAEAGGSTYDGLFAYERGERGDVPPNTVVEASLSDVGPWLLFTYHGPTLVRCDSNTVTSFRQPGTILIPDGAGGYDDGDEVRMVLSDAPGSGDAFRTPGQYWMQYNGTVTISDVEYPVYTGPGSKRLYLKDCEDGVDGYREWWVPAWTEVGSFVAGDPP